MGMASPCRTEEEVKELLHEWKELHPKASHLCYAFRVGVTQPRFRASDDGEPTNSAGAPILGQIQSHELYNILIGVVRYYGGTKLGVGGLIQAYRAAAQDALEQSEMVESELQNILTIRFDHLAMPHLMNWLKQHRVNILKQDFGMDCMLQLEIRKQDYEEVKEQLKQVAPFRVEKEMIGQ